MRRSTVRIAPSAGAAGVASAIAAQTPASVSAIEDAQSRLIAAALCFRAGTADPATLTLAADTASEQGGALPAGWLDVFRNAPNAGAADDATPAPAHRVDDSR